MNEERQCAFCLSVFHADESSGKCPSCGVKYEVFSDTGFSPPTSCPSCETLRSMYKQKLSELFHMENKMKRMQVLIDAAEKMADTLAYAPALGRLWINKPEWDAFEEISKAYRDFVRSEK